MANPNTIKPRALRVVGTGAKLLPGALAPRQTALLDAVRELALDADNAALAAAVRGIEVRGLVTATLNDAVRAVAGIAAEAAPEDACPGSAIGRARAKDVARAASVLALLAVELRRVAGR